MATNSWSKQVLVSEECRKGEEVRTENALIVCNQNLDLFQKEFIDGKHWDDITPILPFDFIVLGGYPCPRGKFYEVEYTHGSRYGTMCRGLIQAVNPVEDLQLILGALIHHGVLPDDIVTHKAFERDDIDAVQIVSCSLDDNKAAYISGGHITPRKEEYSVLDTVLGKPKSCSGMRAVCLEYYAADHCREVWIDGMLDKFDSKPVFVCGSSNVMDPAFAEMREEDLTQLIEHINEARQIAQDYGLQYIFCYETGKKHPDTGNPTVDLMNYCTNEFAFDLAAFIAKRNNEHNEEKG